MESPAKTKLKMGCYPYEKNNKYFARNFVAHSSPYRSSRVIYQQIPRPNLKLALLTRSQTSQINPHLQKLWENYPIQS